jgi:hypothetical protein
MPTVAMRPSGVPSKVSVLEEEKAGFKSDLDRPISISVVNLPRLEKWNTLLLSSAASMQPLRPA